MSYNDFIMDSYIKVVQEMDIADISKTIEKLGNKDLKAEVVRDYYQKAYEKGLMTEKELETIQEKIKNPV